MGNVYMEADQIRYKGQYRTVQEALDNGGGGGGTTVVANPEGGASADLSKLQVGRTIYGIPAEAGDISYDNTSSGMAADDVQEAIDELKASIPGVATTSAAGLVQPDGTTITIANGVISAVGGGGAGEVYSTTETVIGTWMGKTLYRKCYEITNLSIQPNGDYTIEDVFPADYVKRLECMAMFFNADSQSNMLYPVPFASRRNIEQQMSISISGNNNPYFVIGAGAPVVTKLIVIIEYTKS